MTKVLHEDAESKVVAFYVNDTLVWTTTYLLDAEGFAKKMIRVSRDGQIIYRDVYKLDVSTRQNNC